MLSIDDIRRLIAENMRREWIEREPDRDCFDYSEERMAALTAFIEEPSGRDAVRRHILSCSRCRFLYSRLLGWGSDRLTDED
jgi:hypothetical protein